MPKISVPFGLCVTRRGPLLCYYRWWRPHATLLAFHDADMKSTMSALIITSLTLLAVLQGVSAKDLSGVLRYHTEGLNRANYAPSYGHICNTTECVQGKRRPVVHPPVLSLDELERRQRVAALHRQYISSQQYQPHPQPFDEHKPRPHYSQHLAQHPPHNGTLHTGPARSYTRYRRKHSQSPKSSRRIPRQPDVAKAQRDSRPPMRPYDMTHSRVIYDFGVEGLSASLSYRVSPTSPPHPLNRTLTSRLTTSACDHPRGHVAAPASRGPSSFSLPATGSASSDCNQTASDTVRVIRVNDTCIQCPRRQLARAPRNQVIARVPRPKLRFCSRYVAVKRIRLAAVVVISRVPGGFYARPDDSVTDFPLMVLRGPRMGSFVEEGDYTIVFKTLVPLPAKTCIYTLQVYSLRCPPLPPAKHGTFECTNGYLWGSRCHLRCEPGFHLQGLTTVYGYLLNQPNVTASFKCVKRKRQAIWKTPNFQPICTDKIFFARTTTKAPVVATSAPITTAVSSPAPKRKVACRWPKEPMNGWASCGQRGRWKKRIFVREHLPCFRGCNSGFEPSVPLKPDGKKNKISCVGGSWIGFQNFQCLNKQENVWRECRELAEANNHVSCRKVGRGMRCRLECPEGFVVPRPDRPMAELVCGTQDAHGHKWPACKRVAPPELVAGCKKRVFENATFPLVIEKPVYSADPSSTGPIEVHCNVTTIQQHGEFGVFCSATDVQLDTQSNCTFTVVSTASLCPPFKPGPHVVANCDTPAGLSAGKIGKESLPVNASCEFACERGYTLPTSRLNDTYTTCQNDGTWTVTDFDLCRPLRNPVTQRQCENQTFVVERIPSLGIPLQLPEYIDSLEKKILPECDHVFATEFGETTVFCEFDDYEIRTRSSCTFYVTVQRP
ncbi:multiple C2 and transmembrane domain-containing protein 1-like [Tropilaelaps mercedesae]|uniref:Multiple C2 and transmembrane domain-containing protein 1-like n=1 Tax=Tropilaelaps mercedesae TaxID=418985 RepID=A0A1V9XIP6_9ACAR|nr:multiple C2 and transmembrane domain-containing protein 1-like [Tropilaelaps mercedesae]